MQNPKTLALFTLLAIGAAAPGVAAADHPRDAGWQQLGDVGTHRHDAEDYVRVKNQRLDALQLRARGRAVSVDRVVIQFTDGSRQYVDVHGWIRPGQPLTIDVPGSRHAIKMLVLDYGNAGPYWRARETAHLTVLGLVSNGRERVVRVRPPAVRAPEPVEAGFEIRGGVRVRVR
jgi:hypothetical protein